MQSELEILLIQSMKVNRDCAEFWKIRFVDCPDNLKSDKADFKGKMKSLDKRFVKLQIELNQEIRKNLSV